MHPRVLATAAALLLMVGAAIVLMLQVTVHDGGVAASCGAPFDVISGRADWQTWYAEDLIDPRLDPQSATLIRTEACPTALNRRTMMAGGLGTIAVIAIAASLMVGARDRAEPRGTSLGALGAWVTGIGAALAVAGLAALVVLLANPSATLFLYVDRWVVATIGLIALIPTIALAAGGRALMLFSRTSTERSGRA